MKKIYLVLLAALGLTFTSCLMEEKEIFDKTPAERMDAYLEEYRNILASSEEGWLLQYYADAGGYPYIVKFTKNEVTAYFQLADDVSVPVTTLYKMTPDDGPVLAFDTYNEYLHFFATPDANDYEALHGDYEFRILGKNADASEVYIKGRRSGTNLKLVKFSGDPVQYMTACNAVQEGMASPAYKLTVNGVVGSCSLSSNVFTYSYNVVTGEGEEATVTESHSGSTPLCYTPEGVVFFEPVTIDGVEYTNLVYNAEDLTLATEDGKVVVFQVIPPLNQQFVTGDWFFKFSAMGEEGQYYFNLMKNKVTAIGEEVQYAFIGSMLYGSFGFNFISSGYGGVLNLAYALEGEDVITLQFAMAGAGNGVWYHNNAGMNYPLYAVGYSSPRTFKLTADDMKNPTQITMTEVGNEAHWMTLFAAQIAYPFNN